jgi:hypothetical protein
MAYQNTSAEFRPELQVKVEEAMAIDNKFIAEGIFPVFPVKTRKGYYKKVRRGKGQLMANPGTTAANDPLKRAPGTAYREISRTTEQDSWLCVDRGLEESVDDVDKQEESRFFDLESSTAVWLMRNIRIAREARAAAFTYNPDIWGVGYTGDVAFTEANIETFDAPKALVAAAQIVDKRGENANTLVMSRMLKDLILRSQLLRIYFFGISGGNAAITLDMLAEKFGFEQILVGAASYDTTKPGKDSTDANLTWTWNDRYMWVGNVVDGAPEMGGAGRTFMLEDLTHGQLFLTETYRDEKIRCDRLRVRQDEEMNTVNECSGTLIQVNE